MNPPAAGGSGGCEDAAKFTPPVVRTGSEGNGALSGGLKGGSGSRLAGACGVFAGLSAENICVNEPESESGAGLDGAALAVRAGIGAGDAAGAGALKVENICVKEPGLDELAAGVDDTEAG